MSLGRLRTPYTGLYQLLNARFLQNTQYCHHSWKVKPADTVLPTSSVKFFQRYVKPACFTLSGFRNFELSEQDCLGKHAYQDDVVMSASGFARFRFSMVKFTNLVCGFTSGQHGVQQCFLHCNRQKKKAATQMVHTESVQVSSVSEGALVRGQELVQRCVNVLHDGPVTVAVVLGHLNLQAFLPSAWNPASICIQNCR